MIRIVSKVIIIAFINFLIYFLLLKNDAGEWLDRALHFYNLRSPSAYEYISDIPEINNPEEDVRDSTRHTPMEDRLHYLQNNVDNRGVAMSYFDSNYGFFNAFSG